MTLKNRFLAILGLCLIFNLSYAANPHWTYDEQIDWGALINTDSTTPIPALYPFAECALGKKQSPLDIVTPTQVAPLNLIQPNYLSIPLAVENNGHTLKINTPLTGNENKLLIGREIFPLVQFHFHAPSEHTLNGQAFPLEIHFVHVSPNGNIAVLGVFIKAGAENAEFQKIVTNAPLIAPSTNPTLETLNLPALLPQKRQFFHYAGSLTTPPCTEGVNWYVLRQPIEISKAQIAQFETFYNHNAREPQAANGRIVESLH